MRQHQASVRARPTAAAPRRVADRLGEDVVQRSSRRVALRVKTKVPGRALWDQREQREAVPQAGPLNRSSQKSQSRADARDLSPTLA